MRDFIAIAELKIVDSQEHDLVICDHVGSVKELEAVCRKRLRPTLTGYGQRAEGGAAATSQI